MLDNILYNGESINCYFNDSLKLKELNDGEFLIYQHNIIYYFEKYILCYKIHVQFTNFIVYIYIYKY